MNADPSVAGKTPGRARVLTAVILIGALGGFAAWLSQGELPELRREPASTAQAPVPRESVRGGHEFVGAERCASCHADVAQAHALSGHARTFSTTRDSALAKSLCGTQGGGADEYGRFSYSCPQSGLNASLPQRFGERLLSLDFALGSGTHAVTFLSLLSNGADSTLGVEHRLSWYRRTGELGVTPGQSQLHPEEELEYFGRVIDQAEVNRCVGCHTTRFELHGAKLQNVLGGVQCESCHGPGAAHVLAAERGDAAESVTASLLPQTALEEITQCGRCHRMPELFAAEDLDIYPRAMARFQPVGLMRSRCYSESDGRLRCTSCHDPHGPVSAETEVTQVAACRACHQPDHDPECPVSPTTGCIACHVPAVESLPGLKFHDHWIRKRPTDHVYPEDDPTKVFP